MSLPVENNSQVVTIDFTHPTNGRESAREDGIAARIKSAVQSAWQYVKNTDSSQRFMAFVGVTLTALLVVALWKFTIPTLIFLAVLAFITAIIKAADN